MEMRLAVCHGPYDLRVERRPVDLLGSDDVLVRAAYCGVCPWDLRVYSGLSSSVRYPLQMGHELSGVVTEVGDRVEGLAVGDRVVVDAIRRCGTCPACRRGLENHCENADYSRGGFAEWIVAPAANVYRLQPNTPLHHAALTEPLACIVRAQNRLQLEPGTTALVAGCGPLGLLHAQLLQQRGVRVLVTDPVSQRREMALELGAKAAFDPNVTDLTKLVREATDGWGVEAAVIATGDVAAARQSLPVLAFNGTLLLFAGIHPRAELVLDPNEIHYQETWITGSADYTRAEFRQSLALIEQGALQLKPLITDIFSLTEIVAALETVRAGQRLKVMVQCSDEPL